MDKQVFLQILANYNLPKVAWHAIIILGDNTPQNQTPF